MIQVAVKDLEKNARKLEEIIAKNIEYSTKIQSGVENINASVNETGFGLSAQMKQVLDIFSSQVKSSNKYSQDLLDELNTMISATDSATVGVSDELAGILSNIDSVTF